jgi:hypothetical protein
MNLLGLNTPREQDQDKHVTKKNTMRAQNAGHVLFSLQFSVFFSSLSIPFAHVAIAF